ncbi:hypothetical protein HPY86_07300 [candidate division WOR-3 bacterium]|nr:hypothetical protein [candidate division WOR-3 bacterium]
MRNFKAALAIVALCLCVSAIKNPAAGDNNPTKTDTFYFIRTDSAVIELIAPAYPPTQAPSLDPEWKPVTIDQLHSMGIMSPSENEMIAKQQGHYQEAESDGGTKESRWFVVGTGSGGLKWIQSGAGSARPWYLPGLVYAKTELYKDGQYLGSATIQIDPWWSVKIQTWRYKWTDGSTHFFENRTTHYYGRDWIYGYLSITW